MKIDWYQIGYACLFVGAIRSFVIGPNGDGQFGDWWVNKAYAFVIAVSTLLILLGRAR